MKETIIKPMPPAPLKEKRGFGGKWNPKKPCNIHNPLPQAKWPFKFGQAVYVVTSDYEVVAGRVRWFNPSRKVDADVLITAGHPLFNVTNVRGSMAGADMVFPYTAKGWQAALRKISDLYLQERKEKVQQMINLNRRVEALTDMVNAVRKQADEVRLR